MKYVASKFRGLEPAKPSLLKVFKKYPFPLLQSTRCLLEALLANCHLCQAKCCISSKDLCRLRVGPSRRFANRLLKGFWPPSAWAIRALISKPEGPKRAQTTKIGKWFEDLSNAVCFVFYHDLLLDDADGTYYIEKYQQLPLSISKSKGITSSHHPGPYLLKKCSARISRGFAGFHHHHDIVVLEQHMHILSHLYRIACNPMHLSSCSYARQDILQFQFHKGITGVASLT